MTTISISVANLYKDLFAGNRLTIRLADKKAYESLRVSLHKLHQHSKLLMELTDDALCARYTESEGVATFWLGAPSKVARRGILEVISVEAINPVEDSDEPVRYDLGEAEDG